MANTVNLYFDVDKQTITRTDEEKVASGAVNTIVANFNFGEAWEDLYTFCRFESAGGMKDVRIVDNVCVVPWEVLQEPVFTMACFGSKSTDVMLTTEKISVKVYKGVNFIVDAALPANETPELIQQYENIVNKAAADQAANNAAQAENNSRTDEMVSEVEGLVMNNLQPTIADAADAATLANAAAQRANNAVTDLESGSIPIITVEQIDDIFARRGE